MTNNLRHIVATKVILPCFLVFCSCYSALCAIVTERPIATDSRVKTFIYNESEILEIKFRVGYQSIIEFSNDEEVELISLGDPFPWKMTPVGRRLFVKALEPNSQTNMTIITNRRTYLFEIKSADVNDKMIDDELVYVARFFYPDLAVDMPILSDSSLSNIIGAPNTDLANTGLLQSAGSKLFEYNSKLNKNYDLNDPETVAKLRGEFSEFDPRKLNFSYSFAGDSKTIVPIKVFDNGRETYFQFANSNEVVPNMYYVNGSTGQETMLYPRARGNNYVVDRTARQFTLRLGDQLICVFNDAFNNGNVFIPSSKYNGSSSVENPGY